MNDLYFAAKIQKDLQGRKTSRQAYIFAVNSMKKGKNPILAIKNKGYRMVSRITVGSSHNVALATLYQVCLMPYGITLLCKDTNLPLVRFANVGSSHRVVGAIKR